jgi:putative heme-binding domain-containing protein
LRDYNLHKRGALWHVRQKNFKPIARPTEPKEALLSADRKTRDAAARKLAATNRGEKNEEGRAVLLEALKNEDVRVRATALAFLPADALAEADLLAVAKNDPEVALRALAVRKLAERGGKLYKFLFAEVPASIRREALTLLHAESDLTPFYEASKEDDPFLQSAAIQAFPIGKKSKKPAEDSAWVSVKEMPNGINVHVKFPEAIPVLAHKLIWSSRQRALLLLAIRKHQPSQAKDLSFYLTDPSEEVRFLAVKWISDEKLSDYRPWLIKQLDRDDLNVRMYLACATALGRIDGTKVDEAKLADHFLEIAANDSLPASRRVTALRLVPATHKKLSVALLAKMTENEDAALQLEAVRALSEHTDAKRIEVLKKILLNEKLTAQVRAEALVGLAEQASDMIDTLLALAEGENALLRDESLRALVGVVLQPAQHERLAAISAKAAEKSPDTAALVTRIRQPISTESRPELKDITGWQKLLDGEADATTGRRVFFHPKLGGCFRCHMVEGRGREVGPELSSIGRTEPRHILESFLQPNNTVAPHYQVWNLSLADGRNVQGMLIRTQLDEYTYVDLQGKSFNVRTGEIEETTPLQVSLMPTGLVERMTLQEVRDLWAYLRAQK